MTTRRIGSLTVSPIGYGCMSLSHAYGTPPSREYAEQMLNRALDAGYTFLDTAALYGFGANETLIGEVLKGRRQEFVLASKCGMFRNDAGVREINGRPEAIRKVCEASLKRLQTDVIDLYYLHRWDRNVPIEESVGTLGELVREGKIREVGLSEVSAETLLKAHKEYPIAAVQSEYSLWSRNVEIAVLDACKELGTTLVAFSPLARKFLTNTLRDLKQLEENDFRSNMPRFSPENYARNLQLLDDYLPLAEEAGCTPGQLALAWLLKKAEHIVPIPGTAVLAHLEENIAAAEVNISEDLFTRIDAVINQQTVVGERYPAQAQSEVDTERF
ncbi:aldo/keto reductase [Aliamphritea spongicola]|uniref:aldo/keto reductase n=1 Tax=Aliamphritea spongicola TaxID=707589 RepID=UPI00196B9DBD|nr:aldo/keto reductase [Aliamphritea spongicola]MBN3560837.1 aldo/keto reductase [Aliamphritea spongicola]